MAVTPVSTVEEKPEFKVIGTRPIRHDGLEKVTGQARYGADISLPGMLHGKVLRSPHAHAVIKSIDASRALALPGVEGVMTSADLPQPSGRVADLGEGAMMNPKFLSNNTLASGKVLYKGHAVAAVAAVNQHVAEEALDLIDVEYEVLPPVLNALDAMKEGAPVLHERLYTADNPFVRPGGLRDDSDTNAGSNVASRFVFELGDLEKGFAEADIIVEREFKTKAVHQGYIEPHSATATWNRDWPHNDLVQLAGAVRDARPDGVGLRPSRIADQGHSPGNRGRLWRQDIGIPGTGGCASFEEDGPPGEGFDEPSRGIRRDGAYLGFLYEGEDGRDEGRADYGNDCYAYI